MNLHGRAGREELDWLSLLVMGHPHHTVQKHHPYMAYAWSIPEAILRQTHYGMYDAAQWDNLSPYKNILHTSFHG